MNAKRFIPLVIITAALGGGGYVISTHPEWFENEGERKLRIAYTELIKSTQEQIKECSGDTSKWQTLQTLTDVTMRNDTLQQKFNFARELAAAAWQTWSVMEKTWRKSNQLENPPFDKLEEFQAIASKCTLFVSYKNQVREQRATFQVATELFADGRKNMQRRLAQLAKSPFREGEYTTLSSELAELQVVFGSSNQFRRAVSSIQIQRDCHSKFHNEYERLERIAEFKDGDRNKSLPSSASVNNQFTCGGKMFQVSQFPHYLTLGRNTANTWTKPIW